MILCDRCGESRGTVRVPMWADEDRWLCVHCVEAYEREPWGISLLVGASLAAWVVIGLAVLWWWR